MTEDYEPKYAGSDWLLLQLRYLNPDKNPEALLSDLGQNVANLLGELFCGIYHLDHKALYRVDWSNNICIVFSLGWHQLATVDFDELTELVFLAHHMAIRVSIEASTHKYLKLIFHQRTRIGGYSERHPTLDEAVAIFKKNVSIPEYTILQDITS